MFLIPYFSDYFAQTKEKGGEVLKKALIIVDYQKDFVDGVLGFKEAEALEKPIARRSEQALEEGWDLLFTLDVHDESYPQTIEGKHIATHCRRESEGAQLYGAVKAFLPKAKAAFEKQTYGSLELADYLKKQQYEEVELAGVVTDICVLSNAVLVRSTLPQAEITLNRRLVASPDYDKQQKALDIMAGLHINITEM